MFSGSLLLKKGLKLVPFGTDHDFFFPILVNYSAESVNSVYFDGHVFPWK